jgi:MFS family permease
MKNSKNSIYIVDFIMSFITVFGVVMFLPMLPHIQEMFGVSVSQISWIANVQYITMIIFSTFVSKLINKIGIKNMLLISLILWITGILIEILAFSNLHFDVFISGRFIEGIGEAFIFPLLLSMSKAELKNQGNEKVGLSLIEFGAALGGLISGIISGEFINSPRQFLVIPISIGVLVGAFILMKLKAVALIDTENKQSQGEGIKESTKAYISLLFMIFITQTIFASIQVYLAYYMDAFALTSLTGTVISIQQILVAIGTIAPNFFVKKISFKTTRNIIFLAFIFGIAIVSMQISVYLSIVGLAIIAFFVGVGFTILNIYISKVARTKVSKKLSIYTSIRYAGGFILSFMWGRLIQGYREAGQSYGKIFKNLYTFEGIMAIIILIVIIYIQKDVIVFKNKLSQRNLQKEA